MARPKVAEEDGLKNVAIAVGTALGKLAHSVGIGSEPAASPRVGIKRAAKKAVAKTASKKKAMPARKVISKKVVARRTAPRRAAR
jgi:hypothetical protein